MWNPKNLPNLFACGGYLALQRRSHTACSLLIRQLKDSLFVTVVGAENWEIWRRNQKLRILSKMQVRKESEIYWWFQSVRCHKAGFILGLSSSFVWTTRISAPQFFCLIASQTFLAHATTSSPGVSIASLNCSEESECVLFDCSHCKQYQGMCWKQQAVQRRRHVLPGRRPKYETARLRYSPEMQMFRVWTKVLFSQKEKLTQ